MALKFKDFIKGIRLRGVSSDPSDNLNGSLWYNSVSARVKAYLGGGVKTLVSETDTQTLTNKEIVVANNTVTTAASGNLVATELNAALAELQSDIDTRQPVDAELTAIAALATDGLIAKTGAGTAATRIITGEANEISVSDGDGVAGNPLVGIADNAVLPGTAAVTVPIGTTLQRPGTPVNGQIRYNSDLNIFEGYQNGTWGPIAGSGAGTVKANYLDPISTSLPTGLSVTIDGQAGVDGDLVLFTNLLSGNNRVYELSGVGVSLAWAPQTLFEGSQDPSDGDSVRILSGAAFKEQLAVFDGSDFKVNDTLRLFDEVSADYLEIGSIKTVELVNNTTNGIVFSVSLTGSENFVVNYSVLRGAGIKETGQLFVTSDGTSTAVARSSAFIGDSGVTFDSDINAGNIRLLYTTTNTGVNAIMKLSVQRWANASGGAGGIPNYGTSPSSSVPASGATGDVQFRGSSGFLDGDVNFKWDQANSSINLNGLRIKSLQGPVSLLDNQAVAVTAFSYPKTISYMVIEYSISRDTDVVLGRLLVVNNGTSVSLSDDNVGVGSVGISLAAVINGSDIDLTYTSTNTGFNGSLKYNMRYWS